MKRHLENEAIEALQQTLGQISVVKTKGIKVESHRHRSDKTIIANVEIYGRESCAHNFQARRHRF